MRVKGDRNKCHRLRHKKVLNVYENFNTYIVVVSLRASPNFVSLCVHRHVMNLSFDDIRG